ncbi:hypothetical protein BH11BAC7_BH11BAC7_06040 [soil metagenome]
MKDLQSPNKSEITKTIFWLTFFSIAMGYLETAVVVYVRKLYYPDGFEFPLVPVSHDIAITEFWREAATLVMLVGIGILAGKNAAQRFVFFLYAFAIWDIFYYVFLYVLLGWPQSLFTWDILFIIPVPWVGPVLCPCLVSLTMIAFTASTVYWQQKGKSGKLIWKEGSVLLLGCVIVITSFIWDYLEFVHAHPTGKSSFTLAHNKELFSEGATYVPKEFSWLMFWCGQIIITGGVLLFHLRMRREKKTSVVSRQLQAVENEQTFKTVLSQQ